MRLAEAGEIKGSVLDVGCGTGENALYLASLDHEVWGIDFAPVAIEKAQTKAWERGLEITLLLDESAFAGQGVFVLGSVLEQFFAKYVSINSFTETVVQTLDRGEVARWPVRTGRRPVL